MSQNYGKASKLKHRQNPVKVDVKQMVSWMLSMINNDGPRKTSLLRLNKLGLL